MTRPTFTSVSSLPGTATVLGTTTVVRANSATKAGAANLTVVQLRKTGDKRDFFFLVPYMGAPSPTRDVLKFGTNIKQVDIAVNMDTTGSMGGAIDALKTSLSTTVFPDLKKAIPSVGIGVVDQRQPALAIVVDDGILRDGVEPGRELSGRGLVSADRRERLLEDGVGEVLRLLGAGHS